MTKIFSFIAALTVCSFSLWVVGYTFLSGYRGFNYEMLFLETPSPNSEGGIFNAICGSFILISMASCVSIPVGISIGIYMSEYKYSCSRFTIYMSRMIRLTNQVQMSIPSILVGVFVSNTIVSWMNGFSAIAGSLSLSIMIIPLIANSTESTLLNVSNSLRESAYALGSPKWKVIYYIVLKSSRNSIFSNIILTVSRISGETSPLLFTSFNNQFFSTDIFSPISTIPVMIFTFALSPYKHWQELAWIGACCVILFLLFVNTYIQTCFVKEREQK